MRRLLYFLLCTAAAWPAAAQTALTLVRREHSLPAAPFVWQTLEQLSALPAETWPVAAAEFRTARERGAQFTSAERLFLTAWAEQNLTTALDDCLAALAKAPDTFLPETLPFIAGAWCRLAARDWPGAFRRLQAMPSSGAAVALRRRIAETWPPERKRLAAFLNEMTRGTEPPTARSMADAVLWSAVQLHGMEQTTAAVRTLKNASLKAMARERLTALRRSPPLPLVPAATDPPATVPALRTLTSLNRAAHAAPLALFKNIRALSPPQAAENRSLMLQNEIPADSPAVWMLTMRASEQDAGMPPDGVADTMLCGIRVQGTAAWVWSRRASLDAAALVNELRAIPSPAAQREALTGFLLSSDGQRLIHSQLGSPAMAFAGEIRLPASCWSPALRHAAAGGATAAALSFAWSLPGESALSLKQLRTEILTAAAFAHPGPFTLNDPQEECQAARAAAAPWLPELQNPAR